jgi:DNA-directed RNA polymerase specialized sigma24 family protein
MKEGRMFSNIEGERRAFEARLAKSCDLLHIVAFRLLNSREQADEAVRNCLTSAARTLPSFESEGAFRSWLLRILIDEALQILRQQKASSTTSSEAGVSGVYCDPLLCC